jgi:hypothetical protein
MKKVNIKKSTLIFGQREYRNIQRKQRVMAHIYNLSIQEAEARRIMSVRCQAGLHSETMSENKKKKSKEKRWITGKQMPIRLRVNFSQ